MRPERLLKKSIRGMSPYNGVEPTGIRMDTNANLLGANPVVTKFFGQFDPLELNDYPTPHSDLLRRRLAQLHGLGTNQFIVGNGADELLDLTIKCFIDPGDRLVLPDPSFGMYETFGRVNCADIVKVPLTQDWQLDVDRILSTRATMAVICSPNNPTGNSFNDADLESIIEEFDGIVVLDEAYTEYACKSHLPLIDRYRNLVVLRSFSKAYGLAGLRVGYAASTVPLIEQMYRAKAPYNLNVISEGIAAAALMERKFLSSTVRRMEHERERMRRRLEELGFMVYPSETNFLLVRTPVRSRTLCRRLYKRGIVIKDLNGHPRLRDHVRITLGDRYLNERLLRALRKALGKKEPTKLLLA